MPSNGASSHASQFAELLGSADADLELLIGSELKSFRVHRLVMKVRSPYFQALLSSGMRECDQQAIELPSMSAQSFHLVLQYVYGGYLKEDVKELSTLTELFEMTDFLQILDFKQYAVDNLDIKAWMEQEWNSVDKDDATAMIGYARKWLRLGGDDCRQLLDSMWKSKPQSFKRASTECYQCSPLTALCIASMFQCQETNNLFMDRLVEGCLTRMQTPTLAEQRMTRLLEECDRMECTASTQPGVGKLRSELLAAFLERAWKSLGDPTLNVVNNYLEIVRVVSNYLKEAIVLPAVQERPEAKKRRISP